jgi:hypothetical protein
LLTHRSLWNARNLFKSEHVYKAKEDNTAVVAKSLQQLQSDFGGTENLFQ